MMSIGVRKTSPSKEGPASYPTKAEPMQLETAGGDVAATGGSIAADDDAVYPTPLPTFEPDSLFKDKNGYMDAFEVNTHTAVIGASGMGKTHLTCHLIMQWAPRNGWNYGWVRAIMPKGTWLAQQRGGKRRYWQRLLDKEQVIFIDDYSTSAEKGELMRRIELTVRDNMMQSVPSLLIIDDCEDDMVDGKLPIRKLLKNGRVMGLTVITLWQGWIKSTGHGPAIRKQMSTVVCFSDTIPEVTETKAWVPNDHKKEFLAVTKKQIVDRTAAVITTKNKSLFKMEAPAPELLTITPLGRSDLRKKLLPLDGSNGNQGGRPSTRRPRETACDEDDDEWMPNRRATSAANPKCPNPPGCQDAVLDEETQMWICPKCGHELPDETDDEDYDPGDDDDDEDDDGDGGSNGGPKREREPSPQPNPDQERRSREAKRQACWNAATQRIACGSSGYGGQMRAVTDLECQSILAVTDRVTDWILRLGVAEATVLCTAGALITVTNTVYANIVRRTAVDLDLGRQFARLCQLNTEVEFVVAELQQPVAAGVAGPAAADPVPEPTLANTGFWYLLKTLSESGAQQYRPAFLDGGVWYYISGNPNDATSPKKRNRIPPERYNAIEARAIAE